MNKIILCLFISFCINKIIVSQQNTVLNKDFYNTWIDSEYYCDIKNGIEPYQLLGKLKDIMQLSFTDNDSLLVGSFSEGLKLKYKIKNSQTVTISKFDNHRDSAVISLVYKEKEPKLILNNQIFTRLPEKYNGKDGPIKYINDNFFSGAYYSADSSLKVEFFPNGNIKGLKEYNKYIIPLTPIELLCNFSTVVLQEVNGKVRRSKVLHWEKNQDKLVLFEVSSPTKKDGYSKSQVLAKYIELIKIK